MSKSPNRWENILEYVAIFCLLGVSVLALIYSIFDLDILKNILPNKNSNSLLLTLMGLLGTAVGLERLIKFKYIENNLDSLMQDIQKINNIQENNFNYLLKNITKIDNIQIINDPQEVYKTAEVFIKNAQDEIVVVSYDFSAEGSPPPGYSVRIEKLFNTICEKLNENRHSYYNKNTVRFSFLVCYKSNLIRAERIQELNKLKAIIKEQKVDDLTEIRYINNPFGFNLFIVDKQYALISIQRRVNKINELGRAIKITESPGGSDLIDSIYNWYHNYLWNESEKNPPP